jgi:hypothetical protein
MASGSSTNICREQLWQFWAFEKMTWSLKHPNDLIVINEAGGRLRDWFWIHISRNAVRSPK